MVALAEALEAADFDQARPEERTAVAKKAVESASSSAEKQTVATAAVDALSPADRAKLVTSLVPQNSADRKAVYLAGFIVSAVLAIGLALIAWGAADSGNEGVATAVVAAALSLPSAIIGGLLGAYVSRQA